MHWISLKFTQPGVEIWDWNYMKIYLNNSFDGLNLLLLLSPCQTWLLWISNNLKQFVLVHLVWIQLWQWKLHIMWKFFSFLYFAERENMIFVSEKQEINKAWKKEKHRQTNGNGNRYKERWFSPAATRLEDHRQPRPHLPTNMHIY